MSAPDTNIDKQQKRHYGPLWGFAAVLVAVGIGIFVVPAATEEISEDAGTISVTDPVEASE
ncbi:hypothetical protein [Yoonia sp. BS5-3]|uniref:Uncharacterized protein n=1 Tax=Yoonia phaeophyticola TaxID=3137369 RepID=A0ABZ2UYQ8_9RHOB